MEKFTETQRQEALRRLEELLSQKNKITTVDDILSFVDHLDLPQDLKKDLMAGPINLGVILPPAPVGWPVDTTEQSIRRMIKKVRDYEGGI